VLVLGASGCIGNAVAQAFARSGHEVFGLVRKREKINILAKDESDINDLPTWIPTAERTCKTYYTILDACNENSKKRIEAGGGKLTLIYTSGLW
ncbi:4839_t:CDS:2, partial [Racocetra persica]